MVGASLAMCFACVSVMSQDSLLRAVVCTRMVCISAYRKEFWKDDHNFSNLAMAVIGSCGLLVVIAQLAWYRISLTR